MSIMKKQIIKLNLVSQHENMCNQLYAQIRDGELKEDEAEELITAHRIKLVEALDASFDLDEETDIERAYESILYDALMDDVRRNFGYGKAMDKYEETIQYYNNEAGDEVLRFDRNEVEQVLRNLGRVYRIRQVGIHLGLLPNDVDRITQNLIDKYFKAENK